MAVLSSPLPFLRLLLCLGTLCISAGSAEDRDSCMSFHSVLPSTVAGIQASPSFYESNTAYTISIPIDFSTSSVVLQALDTNGTSVGLWYRADQVCNSSVLYLRRNPNDRLFQATWVSPNSTDITTVKIQAFTVNFYKVATASYVILKKQASGTVLYSTISTTRPTATQILTTTRPTTTQRPTTTPVLTTTQRLTTDRFLNPTSTRTTSKSSANRIFLSPITDAVQILLVFLASKLLF